MRKKKLLVVLASLALLSSCTSPDAIKPVNPTSSSSQVISFDKDKDYVADFKLNVSDEDFAKLMEDPSTVQSEKENYLDFRRDGAEQVMTASTDPKDYFINYVDGDTTHVQTRNYGYTVKIRYLGIDTPESTSEIEEWGKTASNFNKETLSKAKHIILEGQQTALTGKIDTSSAHTTAASADGNGRSLAYVWYTDKEDPVKDDFRCLNLEMVYNGFSQGIGSVSEMGKTFYNTFYEASKSAEYNKRGEFSGKKDPNFCYDAPANLTLKELYESSSNLISTDSPYADQKTLYRIHGFVSRRLETAFYIQDQASYSGEAPEAYGIYVFTYAETPIREGDEVDVIGIISVYGGCYQMQGISYHDIEPDEERDTIIRSRDHEIKPVEVTASQFQEREYPEVLVHLTDHLACFENSNSYGVICEGGTEEVNKYNDRYPFYNSNNKIIGFGRAKGRTIRFVSSEELVFFYGAEYGHTYKFFSGGTGLYNPNGAEYANLEEDNPYKDQTVSSSYGAKDLDVTAIASNYVSTSGKQQLTLTFVSLGDVEIVNEGTLGAARE